MSGNEAQVDALSQNGSISGKFKLVGTLAVGQDVNVLLIVTNLSCDCKTVKVNIRAHSILYTRKPMYELFKDSQCITLDPKEVKQIPLSIPYSQYEDRLTSENMIQVRAVFISEQTDDLVIAEKDIILENPTLHIEVSEKVMLNMTSTVHVSFTNPLSKEVTDCVLIAEGSGLIKDMVTMKLGSVKPGETLTVPIKISPYKPGKQQLLIDFTCSKFTNIKAFQTITVAPHDVPGEVLWAAHQK